MRDSKTESPLGVPARMPPGLTLILGPVVGFAYVIFLPFIGLAMVVIFTARRILGSLFSLVKTIAAFGWRPMEAYLSGKKKHFKK